MTSRDFCYWLQGYLEIAAAGNTNDHGQTVAPQLSARQLDSVQKHLAMVFKHEIDPKFGKDNPALDSIHTGTATSGQLPGGIIARC